MQFGSQLLFKSVQACHLAAIVSWHAKNRGDRLGGLVFNEQNHLEIKPRSRKQGVLHYLHSLVNIDISGAVSSKKNSAQVSTNQPNYFTDNCARLRQLARPGALIYLISDFNNLNDDAVRHLANISAHCELVACQISDPLELALPQSQQQINLAVTDGTKRQVLTLGNNKIAQDYQHQAELINEIKARQLATAGARHIHFSAGASLEQQLKSGALS
jgi:uncharacterized protein (DUF58 family)